MLTDFSVGDLVGASIAATGSVRDLRSQPIGDLDMTLTAADLAPLADQIAQWLPGSMLAREIAVRGDANPGLFADARLDVIGSLAAETRIVLPSQMALSLSGTLGGSTLQGSVTAKAAGGDNAKSLEAQIELANDEATPLLAMAGLPTLPVVSLGPGRLKAAIKSAGADMFAANAGLTGDGFQLTFEGNAGQPEDRPQQFSASGKLVLKAEDVEPWLLAVGSPPPGMGFGTAADLEADADFSGDLLVLNGLSGTVGELSISGDINVDFAKRLPDLSGALALDVLDLEPLVASLFGAPSLTSADGLSWPDAPFVRQAAPVATAELDLSVGTLAAGILPSLHDASLSLKAGETKLSLTEIAGKSAGGSLTGHVDLSNESGNGLVSAQLTLKDADLALLLAETGLRAPALGGRATVSASLGSSGPSVAELVHGLAGSGVVDLKGMTVAGLNGAALPDLIRQADALGQGIDDAATARFAPGIVQSGNFAAGDSTFAFNLASGVLRAPPTQFDRDQAVLTAEGRIDLNAQTVDATAEFALKPGDDALVGAEPTAQLIVSGSASAPQVALDTSGLAQFLTQRQLEIEQARVEAMQAAILEKQRLRREAAYFTALNAQRAAVRDSETLRRAELARLAADAEMRRLKEEAQAKAKAEAEAKAAAEKEKTAEPETKPTKPAPKPQAAAPQKPEPRAQPAVAPAGEFPPPPIAPPAAPPAGDFGDSDFDG